MLENIINLQTLSFLIAILLGLTIHEFSHAFVANYLGDPTAKYAGRLSLNPVRHLDPLGTVLLLVFLFTLGLGFGWGKPVPVNPYNLKHKHGELLVSLAGPVSNFLLAILVAVMLAVLPPALTAGWSQEFLKLFYVIILVNVMLGLFNLLPIPPLDGSKVLFDLLPAGQTETRNTLEKYGFVILIAVILFGITFLGAVAHYIYYALLNLSAILHGVIY